MTDATPSPPDLTAVVDLLSERSPTLGATRLVSLDGPAGSGKTTTAARLADRLGRRDGEVVVLHLDDLYEGWTGLNRDLEHRVLDQVLWPLGSGGTARWQRYDWTRQRFAEWHEIGPPEVLVLEGCGSGAAAFAAYITVLVWVEAGQDTRLRRGVDRDGPDVEPKWRAWMQLEAGHFRANRTRQRADLRIRTD